jgi:hypothetical protein
MASIGRRDFLRMGAAGLAGWSLRSWPHVVTQEFPDGERLGRVCVGKVDIKATPDADGATVGTLYEDAVVVWLNERVGRHPIRINQRWVETPDGYLYAPQVQPVANRPNDPVLALRETSLGQGMWVEVTVPWVRVELENPPPRSPWLKNTDQPRLYYSQILWVDAIREDGNGTHWYRINERFGFGDIFWAPAFAFRPLDIDEIAPIHPEVEEKQVVVDVNHQTMACYENGREVYFCQVSTGAKFNADGEAVEKWSTPVGPHPIWRKVISLHMVGGTTGGGYDLPGIGWTTLFSGEGVAVHSTFWHNDFGVPRSHGCVNAKPEDAKWVFRWVTPTVPYDPGDVTVGMPGGTRVTVVEG